MKKKELIELAKNKAVHELLLAQGNDDTEAAHRDADQTLCDLLETLGFADVVEQYHRIRKWYA